MTERELQSDIAEFQPMLYRLAYSYTGSGADCDDIMQEVFLKLFLRRSEFSDEESKKAWLIRVTVNRCKNHVCAWWRRKREELPEERHAADQSELSDIRLMLDQALRQLKPMYSAVIYLHYYEGFSSAEIARILQISVTAVTTRLQRGREKLRDLLIEQEEQL